MANPHTTDLFSGIFGPKNLGKKLDFLGHSLDNQEINFFDFSLARFTLQSTFFAPRRKEELPRRSQVINPENFSFPGQIFREISFVPSRNRWGVGRTQCTRTRFFSEIFFATRHSRPSLLPFRAPRPFSRLFSFLSFPCEDFSFHPLRRVFYASFSVKAVFLPGRDMPGERPI